MLWHLIHRWHKRIGIVSAVFVIILAVTGIALNHTEELGMQDNFIQNQLLLDAYNIKPKAEPQGFQIDNHWVTQLGERIYFDQKDLSGQTGKLIGVVSVDDFIVIAIDDYLLLVTDTGEVIERLAGSEGVPQGMQAIGKSTSGQAVIKSAYGDLFADFDNADWQEAQEENVQWSEPDQIPATLKDELLEIYRGTGLSLERVMLDLHSGRIVGNWGIFLMDFMAILFLLLAVSGTWMWLKQN